MKIIHGYMLRHFIPVFALSLFSFFGIYLIIDFFEKIDNLLEKNVPTADCIAYFLYKLPFILTQGIPYAALLAAIVAVGLLKRNRELIAMETAGIRTSYYAAPIVLFSLFIAFAHLFLEETVVRQFTQKSQDIWRQSVLNQKTRVSWTQENIWYHGKDTIYQIRLYDPHAQTLEKVSLFRLDSQFRLIERIDANRLRRQNGQWMAEDGLRLVFEGKNAEQEWFDLKELDLPEVPEDFSSLAAVPEELDWWDLYRYTSKIRREGYNSTPYEVELHLRVASPLTSFILAVLGIIIVLRQGLHGGIAVGVGISLFVAALYFAVLQLGCALATAEILSPLVGVWAADAIFSALAGYLWLTYHH